VDIQLEVSGSDVVFPKTVGAVCRGLGRRRWCRRCIGWVIWENRLRLRSTLSMIVLITVLLSSFCLHRIYCMF